MRITTLPMVLAFIGGCSSNGPSTGSGCDSNADCGSGMACLPDGCFRLCANDEGCTELPGTICQDRVCRPGQRGEPPQVTAVDSGGPDDLDPTHADRHLNQHLVLKGLNLQGASVRLTNTATNTAFDANLDICSSTNTELVALIPATITEGAGYMLHVANQSGSCQAPLTLLVGPRGDAGAAGVKGDKGDTGATGAPGVPCSGCVDTATFNVSIYGGSGSAATVARSDHGHTNGIVYTRWGRTTCPSSAELVYAGVLVGKHQTHGGGGTNPMCATLNPAWLDYDSGDNNGNLIYGAEYELGGYAVNTALRNLQEAQVPCAVCYTSTRGVTLVHPGTTICPAGWGVEYAGYLMGLHFQQAAGDTYCVDQSPEASPFGGGAGNENGYLLYFTEGECGALPCGAGQYVQNREITCAVCSR